MKIAILGFDREGRSTLSFLHNRPDMRGAEIWILDKNPNLAVPKGLHSRLGKSYFSGLGNFDVIFRTPGIPYLLKEIQTAKRSGVQIGSATKLFFYEAARLNNKPLIVGITGTKGKGTTSTLLYNMLKASRKNVFLAGNIGMPALELLPRLKNIKKGRDRPIVILELSSFQLQDTESSPDIAVVLEMFPDHQDAHRDLKEYYGAKTNIARFQGPKDKVFFFANDRLSTQTARPGKGKKVPVNEKKFRDFKASDLKMPGIHNFKNAVMAATMARSLGIPRAVIIKSVKNFGGNEHRLELVKKVGDTFFYNDSASTNPLTSAAALRAFPNDRKVLVAGGQDKRLDYAPLAKALKNSKTILVVLFGENKKKIASAIKKSRIPVKMAADLESALRAAYASGAPIVLFSPGATSFDMFKDYADRGLQFKALVKKLK